MYANWKWEICLSLVNSLCIKYCISKKEHTINSENFSFWRMLITCLLHPLWNKQLCIEVKAKSEIKIKRIMDLIVQYLLNADRKYFIFFVPQCGWLISVIFSRRLCIFVCSPMCNCVHRVCGMHGDQKHGTTKQKLHFLEGLWSSS